jgi:hypothetical protein
MAIEGWVAVSKFGLILGTFRENQDEAEDAAQRILRLVGGPQLVVGFHLLKARLVVDDIVESNDHAASDGEKA